MDDLDELEQARLMAVLRGSYLARYHPSLWRAQEQYRRNRK